MIKITVLMMAGTAALIGASIWAMGGPAEAWSVVRLDGVHAVPWMPLETCYAPKFTHAGFLRVTSGDSKAVVRDKLGEPLSIMWVLGDRTSLSVVAFEFERGQWVSRKAFQIDAPVGTPIEELERLRPLVRAESWSYSRSCVPDDSMRLRRVSFEAARVQELKSGVYYD